MIDSNVKEMLIRNADKIPSIQMYFLTVNVVAVFLLNFCWKPAIFSSVRIRLRCPRMPQNRAPKISKLSGGACVQILAIRRPQVARKLDLSLSVCRYAPSLFWCFLHLWLVLWQLCWVNSWYSYKVQSVIIAKSMNFIFFFPMHMD